MGVKILHYCTLCLTNNSDVMKEYTNKRYFESYCFTTRQKPRVFHEYIYIQNGYIT